MTIIAQLIKEKVTNEDGTVTPRWARYFVDLELSLVQSGGSSQSDITTEFRSFDAEGQKAINDSINQLAMQNDVSAQVATLSQKLDEISTQVSLLSIPNLAVVLAEIESIKSTLGFNK